ncbi:MAG TPA: 16S rRNA (adenine(1518)-N(6)/adenine(1519)-N(6))-dimethyltransferase RsmA [Aggregatilineales bacterium]|nr:16S rRNA (adenine(1518)-N(6)/adenine(1519)-N(6))-dimethyltransferase RsmA [Aggregatilineales bacterium]
MNPKYLMDTFGLEPKKSLGQNFLHDPGVLEKIVSTAALRPEDTVLEIGPGTGALTVHLAQSGARVVAVEIDERLLPILERQLGDFQNVKLVHGDILEIEPDRLVGDEDYVVVANLPYYVTSAILQHMLAASHKPRRMVITVQQEVAERIVARPGDLNVLAISVQFYGTPRIAARVNPAVFWPRPDVASAVLVVDICDKPVVDVPSEADFFKVVRAGFGQKRKQLKNSLGAGLSLTHAAAEEVLISAGIDPSRRAETLSLADWAAVTRVLVAHEAGPVFRPARMERSRTLIASAFGKPSRNGRG